MKSLLMPRTSQRKPLSPMSKAALVAGWPGLSSLRHDRRSSKLKGKTTRRVFGMPRVSQAVHRSDAAISISPRADAHVASGDLPDLSSKKGISTRQIQRTIAGSMKTAWFLMHRIRHAMGDSSGTEPLGGTGKIVEADETFIYPFSQNPPPNRCAPSREPPSGEPCRAWRADPIEIPRSSERARRSVAAFGLQQHALHRWRGSLPPIMPEGHHQSVDHSKEEWVRGDVHTNTLENFFSVFKRGLVGVYQHVEEQHLDRYLAEFDFRYNTRAKLGIDDTERADPAIAGAKGKRLTYETTPAAKKAP